MPTDIEGQFDEAMLEIYRRAKAEAGYTATRFLGMVVERLGGRLKTGNLSTGQNRQLSPAAETSEFYFAASSVRKSAWTLVRQLRGPHLSTCA
jgi:hypothetical protein